MIFCEEVFILWTNEKKSSLNKNRYNFLLKECSFIMFTGT